MVGDGVKYFNGGGVGYLNSQQPFLASIPGPLRRCNCRLCVLCVGCVHGSFVCRCVGVQVPLCVNLGGRCPGFHLFCVCVCLSVCVCLCVPGGGERRG
jgi:hypothetical protein